MVPFGGWEMPVEYSGISDEHLAVRSRAGLFDVSHMGEIEVAGRDALAGVQRITSNDAAKLRIGQAQYAALTTEHGTFVDDLLVYRFADDHFLLVVNASNIEKDYRWIAEGIAPAGDAVAVDTSARYALIAVQGPASREVLQPLTGADLGMKNYWFATGEVAGVRATISRTGYTGEDGYEVFVAPQYAPRVWDAILDAGRSVEIRPAGLGARDTLRLEMKYALYGNDIDETTNPFEAGLGWTVKLKKREFVGKKALEQIKSDGPDRALVGFELSDRGIARAGYAVMKDGKKIGEVKSGTMGPSVEKAIGTAYVPAQYSTPGTEFEIEIRGKAVKATVVKTPFYSKGT